MQKVTDEEAIAAKTDKKMQQLVLMKCSSLIEHWVWRMRCRNEAEADDVRQEARIGILRAIQTFKAHPKRGNFHFMGWATYWIRAFGGRCRWGTAKVKQAMDDALSLDAPVDAESGETMVDSFLSNAPSPQETLERLERINLVQAIVAKLDDRTRAVWEGRYLEGKTLQEVADDLGISRERVRQLEDCTHRSLISQAKRALRAALRDDPYEPLPAVPEVRSKSIARRSYGARASRLAGSALKAL